MRVDPRLIKDQSDRRHVNRNGVEILPQSAPLWFSSDWRILPSRLEWFHYRYHSNKPSDQGHFTTIHLFFVKTPTFYETYPHLPANPQRSLIHPKFACFGYERSKDPAQPPTRDYPLEVRHLYATLAAATSPLRQHRPSAMHRRDYLTTHPLPEPLLREIPGVYSHTRGRPSASKWSVDLPDLPALDFVDLPTRLLREEVRRPDHPANRLRSSMEEWASVPETPTPESRLELSVA